MIIDKEVQIGDSVVSVYGHDVIAVIGAPAFRQWAQRFDTSFMVERIDVQSVDFVLRNDRPEMLFAKFIATYTDKNKIRRKSVVFLRGGAIIFLLVLVCEGKEYVVTVTEQRFPAGEYESVGLPAGMLDGSVDYKVVAAKELREETHIVIDPHKLVDMTEMFYGCDVRGVDVSRGGSDEFYRCFFAREDVTPVQLRDIDGCIAGAEYENEQTRVGVVPLEDLLRVSPQASTWIAHGLYKALHL